ncbi:MAG: response regulator, partial [Verrucomicrobiota bacterium]
LDAFRAGSFSAILMDMLMPVMDGLTATRKIRELEAATGARVPIIALTANVLPVHKEICLAAGMDDYLSKPFRKAQLAEKLARFLPAG